MKPFLALTFGLSLLAPSVLGCAGEDMEGEGAAFPSSVGPVGYDAPDQPAAPSSAQAQQGIPSGSFPANELQSPSGESGGYVASDSYGLEAQPTDVAVGASSESYADTDPSALTDFRPALDPYGTWVDDPTYGTVWTPSPTVVGSDFSPYVTAGHWTYDDGENWVWVSDYDWGWAPFHYGRWAYLGSRWGWIPGREYAGAWVSWRYGYDGYDYLGWAPMPPTWYWRGGYAVGLGFYPQAPFVFCGTGDVFRGSVGGYVVKGQQAGVIGAHSRVYAAPSAGRVAAHPGVGGPPPSLVKIPPNQIARMPATDRGVLHAHQFAHPATAQGLGAHAPMTASMGARGYAQPTPQRSAGMTAFGTGVAAYGRNAPVASGPRYQGVAPTPYHAPSYGTPRTFGSYGSAPHYGSTYSSRPYDAPSSGSYGGYGGGAYARPSAGAYGGGAYGARPSAGAYGGAMYGGGGVYGGGGGYHAPQKSGGSSSSSYEEPGVPVHRGGGGGGFRGGGGFHGGGGGGGVSRGGGGHR